MRGIYTYKITLSNTTSTATPPNLQVRLNINFSAIKGLSVDLGNIRFSSDQAGNNLLYAWLESAPQGTFTQGTNISSYTSSNVWVNLGNNIIPANGSLTIYMQVLAAGTEFDGVYWGANPLWTSTYGQYDNGANVFIQYWNFAGTSLPSGLSGNVTINNGYRGTVGTQTGITSTYSTSSAFIFEDYAYLNSIPQGYWCGIIAASGSNGQNGWICGYVNDVLGGTPSSDYAYGYVLAGDGSYSYGTNVPYGTTPHIFGVAWSGSGNATYFLDYTQQANTYPMQSTTNNILVCTAGGDFLAYWLRARTYPPNGTDPVLTSIQILFGGNYAAASTPVPAWSVLNGKPYVTVSAKGISNGLSNIPNDGADFGPDTPGTQTSGIQEAIEYVVNNSESESNFAQEVQLIPIYLTSEQYNIYTPIEIYNGIELIGNNASLIGSSPMNSVIDLSNLPISGSFSIKDLSIYTSYANYCIYGNFSSEGMLHGIIENVNLFTFPLGNTTNTYGAYIIGIEGIRWINVVHFGAVGTSFINLQLTGGSNYFLFCKEYNASQSIITGVANQIIGGTWGPVSIAGICHLYGFNIYGTLTINSFSGFTGKTQLNVYGGSIEIIPVEGSVPMIVLNSLSSESQVSFFGTSFVYNNTVPSGGLIQNNSSSAAVNFDPHCVYTFPSGTQPLNMNTTNGTTAGTVTQTSITCTINYKKVMFYFSGYENDTATNQTINYIFPFTTIANITSNTTGLTISASTSGITITAPNSTTTYSGLVIVEGY
ncbi:MAG: hypothetical protein QW478_12800 [Candidatus Micrarchaeaceae archaeon]